MSLCSRRHGCAAEIKPGFVLSSLKMYRTDIDVRDFPFSLYHVAYPYGFLITGYIRDRRQHLAVRPKLIVGGG